MKINLLKLFLWAFALLLLVGCSMRPLSAGAFMEAYQSVNDSSKTVVGYRLRECGVLLQIRKIRKWILSAITFMESKMRA